MAHIYNFNNQEQTELSLFITGHLYVEYSLSEVLKRALIDPNAAKSISKSFNGKVKLLKSIGRVNDEMESFLLAFNKIRNKFAHDIEYEITYNEMIELARRADKSDIVFSDKHMYDAVSGIKNHYDVEMLIDEVVRGAFISILEVNKDLFPNKEYERYYTY